MLFNFRLVSLLRTGIGCVISRLHFSDGVGASAWHYGRGGLNERGEVDVAPASTCAKRAGPCLLVDSLNALLDDLAGLSGAAPCRLILVILDAASPFSLVLRSLACPCIAFLCLLVIISIAVATPASLTSATTVLWTSTPTSASVAAFALVTVTLLMLIALVTAADPFACDAPLRLIVHNLQSKKKYFART